MDTDRHDDTDQPLAGVRVLDLSRLLPGPYCSLLLANMGADVIKVETPLAGDYARLAPDELGFGGVFEAVNRGKRSIAVDYRKPDGRDLMLRLAETADVFLESSRPGQLDRRGLGAAAVRRANPAIVYCSLSGFGQTGPHRDVPAHDINYLAASGVLSVLGAVGSVPSPPGLQLADIAAGTLAAARISAALVRQARTGRGCTIDAAIIDPVVSWLATLGSGVSSAGTVAGPLAGAYPCYSTYRAADGRWLAVGALEPPFWAAFCRGLGRDDLRLSQFDPACRATVAASIAAQPSQVWLENFENDACVTLVKLPAEALDDEHVRGRGFDTEVARPAPRLGADTDDVLAESGVSPTLVRELTRRGIVAGQQTPARAARARKLGRMLARAGARTDAPAA